MASAFVFDATEADFAVTVAERSHQTPVLVDFWAAWCAPCRMLGPVLEKLADAGDGRFVLAKVDSDQCPNLAASFGVAGIPAVYLLVDGEIVGEFTGFLPESEVRKFLDERLPGEADKIVRRAASFAEADPTGAERMYEQALALQPLHGPARAGLAELLLARGDAARAAEMIADIGKHDPGGGAAELVRARLGFATAGAAAGGLAASQAHAAAHPQDGPAAVAVGQALAAVGRWEEALAALVAAVERDPSFGREHARPVMLQIFQVLGDAHALTKDYRKRLSAAMF